MSIEPVPPAANWNLSSRNSRKPHQVFNITPDDVDTLAQKAGIAQAEADLPAGIHVNGLYQDR